MYTKILVALDESSIAEQVLPYARFLAKSLKLPVELITAIDVTAAATSYEIRDFHAFVRDIRGASEAYLERIAKTFSGTSITASVQKASPQRSSSRKQLVTKEP